MATGKLIMYANIMSKRSLFEDFFRLLTLNCNIDNETVPSSLRNTGVRAYAGVKKFIQSYTLLSINHRTEDQMIYKSST